MPPRLHPRRYKVNRSSCAEVPADLRLWMLRMLVPLGAHHKFIQSHGFDSDSVAIAVGLGHWIDSESDEILAHDFKPARAR